jgi:hypothetical protein
MGALSFLQRQPSRLTNSSAPLHIARGLEVAESASAPHIDAPLPGRAGEYESPQKRASRHSGELEAPSLR